MPHLKVGDKVIFFPNTSERKDIELAIEYAMEMDEKETKETPEGALNTLARFYLDMRLCALLCPGKKGPQTPWWWLSPGVLEDAANIGSRGEWSFALSDDDRTRVEKAIQLAMEMDKITSREAALRCIGSFYGKCRYACSLGEPEPKSSRARIQ
jgi:hypothetical protein